MNPRPYREILDSVAAEHMPAGPSLYPRITARLERKPLMHTLRARPLVALIIVILALLMLSGVAYAVGSLLGYIPGLGLIEQGTPVRVLAEPVSQTKDGVRGTVTQAMLSPNKTVISVTFENIPQPPDPENRYSECPEPDLGERLRLPDGTSLEITGVADGSSSAEGDVMSSSDIFPAIPAGVDQATLLISCIASMPSGDLPGNWEFPLRFVPAPAYMTAVPVAELPTPTPVAEAAATPGSQNLVIEKVLQVGDKLVFTLVGRPDPSDLSWEHQSALTNIFDSGGTLINWEVPFLDPDALTDDPAVFLWRAEIPGKGLSYPITFKMEDVTYLAEPNPQVPANFEFDADADIQPGRRLDKDFLIAGYHVRLATVSLDTESMPGTYVYSFNFECDPDVRDLYVDTIGHPTDGGYGGAPGASPNFFSVNLGYSQPLTGRIQVALSHLKIGRNMGTWQVQWSP